MRQKLIEERKASGRTALAWEEEADPPTDDDEKQEMVVEVPIKKGRVSPIEETQYLTPWKWHG